MATTRELQIALRHEVTFEPRDSPENSRFVFHAPHGPIEATALEAVGPLSQGIRAMTVHASTRMWATPAILALRLMASGNLAEPSPSDMNQILESARKLAATPAEGQRLARDFLASLTVEAPAAATTPQRKSQPVPLAPKVREPQTFSYRLLIDFVEDDSDHVASLSLLVNAVDATRAETPAFELLRQENHHFGSAAGPALRTMLARFSDAWPPAHELLTAETIHVSLAELEALTASALRTSLLANRISVVFPDDLYRPLAVTPVIRRREPSAGAFQPFDPDRPRAFGPENLFTFDWRVTVDGQRLTDEELEAIRTSMSGLVRLNSGWVMTNAETQGLLTNEDQRTLDPITALRASVTGTLNIDGRSLAISTEGWLDEIRHKLTTVDRDLVARVQPEALNGTLRDYQRQGLTWLSQLAELGLGGILADDMGLGKTITLISLYLHLDASAPTLVVCPASMMSTWEREVATFAPSVPVHRFHGPKRHLTDVKEGIVVTTYATLRSSMATLGEVGWAMVVADEAQNVKNPRSAAAKALRALSTDIRMALTGTPVENHLGELWAILDWTTPGLLGSAEGFRRDWARPIEHDHDADRAVELAQLIRPFVLRRRKHDPGIAPELPEKIETDHLVPLTKEQIALYDAVVTATMDQIAQATGIQRRGLIIRLITMLKQICNHPAQYLREESPVLAKRSGKLQLLEELVEEIVDEGQSVLIFTQYAQMGGLLGERLAQLGVDYRFLHGGTTVTQRDVMMRDFQEAKFPVFVLSLKAAGTGLNLTQAEHVIHFDRWWNPAVEDQATDRAHRIGQQRKVQVHRFMSEGTVEEAIAELMENKRAVADAVVNSSELQFTELDDEQLASIVALRRR
ncbi:MAG: DEAD/DEAH box helicase [Actinomycetales bacterium]|nr:DEAD/DEAH box helicase [Actinomycetales bacterium]